VSLEVWALFVLTESLLCLTPGPAVLLVVAQALTRGAAASGWATLGILTGNALYFALSATGLGAVLLASYELFSIVRWLGAAYLIWLGLRALVGRRTARSLAPGATGTAGRRRTFVNGFVLQTANPKALLFFVALLPQFIEPTGPVAVQVLVLAVTSVTIELAVLLAYGVAAGRLHALAVNPRFARLADGVAGTMLVTAGVGVAVRRS
jgi:threonine/homoserine/homoserine lactone efflux protein